MATFPFQRAKPLGWAMFEALTSAQITQIDGNAAQAADGQVWTDSAAFKNWSPSQTVTNSGNALFYNVLEDVWWSIGVSGGNPTTAFMMGGGGVFQGGPAAGTSLTVRKRAVAQRGSRMLFGGLPGASSNRKYLVGDPGSFSTTVATSSQTNTNAVACLTYHAGLDLFVAGHEGTGGIVETSADAGVTWTARTTPNTNPRSCVAIGPSAIVMTSSASTNKALRSTDGINWSEVTLPSSQVWNNVVYVQQRGEFIAIAESMAAVAYSTDGITWSTRALTLPPNIGALNPQDGMLVANGRVIFAMVSRAFGSGSTALIYSQDGGASWRYAATFALAVPIGPLASNGKQMVYSNGTSLVMSVGTGF